MSINDDTNFQKIAQQATLTAKRWAKKSNEYSTNYASKLLADVLANEDGLDYTVAFVDGVVRPEDYKVAANQLKEIGNRNPQFLPWYLRTPAAVGGKASGLAPTISVNLARKVFARLVGDLVIDVTDEKLASAIKRLKEQGARLNVNLLGEAVLGDKEAEKRITSTLKLLQRDDVDYVSLKVSAVTGPHNPWGYKQVVDHATEQLLPLYQYAASTPAPKFINLDMEEYRDLQLTIDVFKNILDRDELLNLEAGIVLQAYLPDTLNAMRDLQEWAAKRRAKGGAPIKVRVVKGANLAMERVDALMHGWNLTTWDTKQATDANYLRILEWAMTKERTQNIRLGVAGHNLFTVAAWELAKLRGVCDNVEFEMLAGMATQQANAIREDVGNILLYVPVVHPEEYDVAISYLVRRLEENSADDNFMASIFKIGECGEDFEKEQKRFMAAVEQMLKEGESRVGPTRTQNRLTETLESLEASMKDENGQWHFENTPDSDPALPANIQWANEIVERIGTSTLGVAETKEYFIDSKEKLEETIEAAYQGGLEWGKLTAKERSEILHKAGVYLAARRGELIEVAGSELGKGLDQSDVEVSEAIDFAHYYAQLALELEENPGAEFTPVPLTLITPPWNFPLAIPAGGILAALAAGSGVLFKPSSEAFRCGAIVAKCLWDAGVPKSALTLLQVGERELGRELVTDDRVERVVLTGGIDTAKLFKSWKPTLRVMAETSGKNSIIITPSADLDLAVKDVVNSAFGHAGQKCSACSYVILVGSVGFSKRVHTQLLDAVKSLNIGWSTDLSAQVGPLSVAPGEKLMRGLTELGDGETWAITPKPLDNTNRLWQPGVRAGVKVGSEYHMTEYFGPTLGIMRVNTLKEAIEAQNMTDYGLTAGLHSLDANEINYWLDNIQAGNVYVNRGITGAIVQRQPFGGWKRSVVGEGTKAGGPNYLYGFGSCAPAKNAPVNKVDLNALKPILSELGTIAEQVLEAEDIVKAHTALSSINEACVKEFDVLHDPSAIKVENNIFRYLLTPVTLRIGKNASTLDIIRTLGAALSIGDLKKGACAKKHSRYNGEDNNYVHVMAGGMFSPISLKVSCVDSIPNELRYFLNSYGIDYVIESEEQFHTKFENATYSLDERVRVIGECGDKLRHVVKGNADVAIYDDKPTGVGRIDILPFVHEQAISVTNHRFGNYTPLSGLVLKH